MANRRALRRRLVPLLFAAVPFAASAPTHAASDPAPASGDGQSAQQLAADTLVDLFSSTCLRSMPDLDAVERMARGMGWVETTGADANVGKAAGPTSRQRSWRTANGARERITLVISQGVDHGKTVSVCAMVAPAMAAPAVEDALRAGLRLTRPFFTDEADGQRFFYWDTGSGADKTVVSATDATPVNHPGVSLAATTIRKGP